MSLPEAVTHKIPFTRLLTAKVAAQPHLSVIPNPLASSRAV